jgi:transcriptional regulator with XRE-family HTH domain
MQKAQIRAARGLLKWTVRDLAEKSGVHRNTISAIENGKSGGDPQTIATLHRALEKGGVVFIKGGVKLR